MKENLEVVKLLACDLRNSKEFPRRGQKKVSGTIVYQLLLR
jgi:hypothetical protein